MTTAAPEVTLHCGLCHGSAHEAPAENGMALKTVCDREDCGWSSLPYSKAEASQALKRAERAVSQADRQLQRRTERAAAVEQRYDIERDRR